MTGSIPPSEPERSPDAIDTTNWFAVSVRGDDIIILRHPISTISRDQALNLAAWLVALADEDDTFPLVLAAVRNT